MYGDSGVKYDWMEEIFTVAWVSIVPVLKNLES